MTFEQWQRRPVYVAQCFTMRVACPLIRLYPNEMFFFRAKRQYRPSGTQSLRDMTATKIRELRNSGQVTTKSIRDAHEIILRSPVGRVWAGDLASALGLD